MKNAWQMVIRYRIVLAAVSFIAFLITSWLRNTPQPASAPPKPAEMPVPTAVALSNSVTEPAPAIQEGKNSSDFSPQGVSVGKYMGSQESTVSYQGGESAPPTPQSTVKEAMAAPTVQAKQVSTFHGNTAEAAPMPGLFNDRPSQKPGYPGEQF